MSDRNEELLQAAESNDTGLVSRLLEAGADTKARTESQSTALHWACLNGNDEMVTALLQHGADADAVNVHRVRPLHVATEKASFETISMLVKSGADVTAACGGEQTPLHVAAKFGRADVVQLLLSHGADARAEEEDGTTPLHYAVVQGSPDVVEMLAEAGADVNALTTSILPRTPLYLAVLSDDPSLRSQLTQYLLDRGADPKVACAMDTTPMHLALEKAYWDIAELMLPAWGGVDGIGASAMPLLCWAADSPNNAAVRFLLGHGADADAVGGPQSWSPLHYAARSGDRETCELLISVGANVNAQAGDGTRTTPLHVSLASQEWNVAELLLNRGADPNPNSTIFRDDANGDAITADHRPLDTLITQELITANDPAVVAPADCTRRRRLVHLLVEAGGRPGDAEMAEMALGLGTAGLVDALLPLWEDVNQRRTDGRTLLGEAAGRSDAYLVERLLERGADVALLNGPEETTALHAAASVGATDVCAALLRAGAAVDARNRDGWTPLHAAVMLHHVGVAKLLLTEGADSNATATLHRNLKHTEKVLNPKCTPLDVLIQRHAAFVRERIASGGPSDPAARLGWMRARVAEGDEDSSARNELAHCLVTAGGRVNDRPAAVRAILSGDRDLSDTLLTLWKDDPNRPDAEGGRLLHHAAAANDLYVAERLLGMGGDPSLPVAGEAEAVSAIDVARHNGHARMLQLLMSPSSVARGQAVRNAQAEHRSSPVVPSPSSSPQRAADGVSGPVPDATTVTCWRRKAVIGAASVVALGLLVVAGARIGKHRPNSQHRDRRPEAVVTIGSTSDPLPFGIAFWSNGQAIRVDRHGRQTVLADVSDGSSGNDPCWLEPSPDRSKIAFCRNAKKGPGYSQTSLLLTVLPVQAQKPIPTVVPVGTVPDFQWSPDGKLLVYRRPVAFGRGDSQGDALYLANADGTRQRLLISRKGTCCSPAWSPTGDRIAFHIHSADWTVFTIRPNGRGLRRIAQGSNPRWSPDGGSLALDGKGGIRVVDLHGRSERLLATGLRSPSSPCFSPDGKRIVFTAAGEHGYDIWTMNADGTGLSQKTNGFGNCGFGGWSRDGEHIIFSNEDGIHYLPSNGTDIVTLVRANQTLLHWTVW